MDFYITDFGAIGDGVTLNTAAVQAAIDAAAAAGGRVIVESGIFKIGSILMHSKVQLHIAADGVLLGSENPADYRDFKELSHLDWEMAPRRSVSCLIMLHQCENAAITGFGTIDCNGHHFVVPTENDRACNYKRIDGFTPPRVVLAAGCRNLTIRDISMINQPAGWSYWIHDCDFVTVKDITIRCSVEFPNNDGVHINCSRDVTVTGCDISCGDDCLVARANSATLKENKPCERIYFGDCRLTSYSAGLRIGWVNDGVIRDVTMENITMTDCSVGISLYIPGTVRSANMTDVGREATLVENFRFRNITMETAGYPIYISLPEHPSVNVAGVADLEFRDIAVRSPHLPYLKGRTGMPIRDIRFVDCSFTKTDSDWCRQRPCTGWLMTPGHTYDPQPMTIAHAENIQFTNTHFSTEN